MHPKEEKDKQQTCLKEAELAALKSKPCVLLLERQKRSSPLLGLQGSGLLLFLLESPAGLFQLREGVGCWVRGHGGILDKGVRGQHVVAELRAYPRVHGSRPLY